MTQYMTQAYAAKLSSYMAALEEKAVAAERHTIGTLEGIETVQ
jgi:hypothetical protein